MQKERKQGKERYTGLVGNVQIHVRTEACLQFVEMLVTSVNKEMFTF